MSRPPVTIIAAMSRNRVIGLDNALPWRLPRDLAFFMRSTMGHSLLMGRRTFESLEGPLRGRTIIVLSRRPDNLPDGVAHAASLEEGLRRVPAGQIPFIAGGAEVYRAALPITERMLLTLVHAELEGDTFFPEFDLSDWHLDRREDWPVDTRHQYPVSFLDYRRRIVAHSAPG